MAENRPKKKVVKTVKQQTPEEKIFGEQAETVTIETYDYENKNVKYRVTALHEGATPVIVNGTVIETFIGCTNKPAREKLIAGAKKVVTVDGNGKDAYKIEVI